MHKQLEMPLMLLLGLILGFLLWGKDEIQTVFAKYAQPTGRFENLDLSGRPTLGQDDAPVTLIEFGDYECPYCQVWHAEVLPLIRQKYRDQVRLVYVDFPLTEIHAQAFLAAEAAHCAGAQGHYWPFHDALFTRQAELGQALYPTLAKELALDPAALTACLEAGTYAERVRQGILTAYDLGFNGTPAFVINGQPLVGAQPFEVFQQIIEQELGQ